MADEIATRTCRVCGGSMTSIKTWLARCPNCRFEASSLDAGAGTGIEGLEQLRRKNFELLLDRLGTLVPLRGKRLLEIGSAQGWFLDAARRRGAEVHGLEPEAANAKIAQAHGYATEIGLFPDGLLDRGPYDVIVFNDVLEHIPGPDRTVRSVEALLAPGGVMVVNLPSSAGALYRIAALCDRLGMSGPFERMWQKGFPSPHVSYFNPANLRQLTESKTGLVQISAHALPSVSRDGLWPRIRSSHPGALGGLMFVGVWLLSFVLSRLPPDIHVAVFAKPKAQSS